MSEYPHYDPKILINAIEERRTEVRDILKDAKNELKAKDARFRLKGWNDKSVVHVPNWITGDLGGFLPELAERVYYDPDDPLRIDCYVGLVGRIGRIKEEEMKEKRDDKKLLELKEHVPEAEITDPRICFSEMLTEKEFEDFINRLKKTKNDLLQKKKNWSHYLSILTNIKNSEKKFFETAFSKDSPWNKEDNKKKKEKQWDDLKESLKIKKSKVDKFLEAVKESVDHCDVLVKQYEEYISDAEIPKYEIAVPVIAFGKFIGVLNFHRENKFDKNAQYLTKIYASRLAVTYLQWQDTLFKNFQDVAQTISAKNNFEVIASEITKGIRIGLQHGLKENEVFPLLYIPKRPIAYSENIDEKEFKRIWKDSYTQRQEPTDKDGIKLWEEENRIGRISIRPDGLGASVIEKWRLKMQSKKEPEAKDRFVICPYVNNPNSPCGSRSARGHKIKTTGCILLTFEKKVNGLLYLHCKEHHFFTDAELNALDTLGIQAAIAINTAKLTGDSYETLYGDKILEHLRYLFRWDKIQGIDDGILLEFLKHNFGMEWINTAKIEKIDDSNVKVSYGKNFLYLKLNDEKSKLNIEIDDGRTEGLVVKTENGKLNIYRCR